MKYLLASISLAICPSIVFVPTASAQWVVYDPANHIQSIIQAAQAIEQVTNQIEQITNQVEMLENMARDLEEMPESIAVQIARKLDELADAIETAEGIGYKVEEIEREYEILYPETYETPPEHEVLVKEARAAWKQSRAGYRDALLVQARVVQSVKADLPELERLMALSSGASGNLGAVQAGNELTALGIKQDMQIQQLMAAQYRAEALARAEEQAIETRAKARLDSFLGDRNAYAGEDW